MEEGKMLEMLSQALGALERQGQMMTRMENAMAAHGEILRQHMALLQEHSGLLKGQGTDLLKIKLRLEGEIGPKLDMLFEGQVNLAEQRDRDQSQTCRRLNEVEDRATILAEQMEELRNP